MISIIMALFALTVLWENITSLQKGSKFWENWEGTDYPKGSDNLNRGFENSKADEVAQRDTEKATE
jgi:hypothetical protein